MRNEVDRLITRYDEARRKDVRLKVRKPFTPRNGAAYDTRLRFRRSSRFHLREGLPP